MKRNLSLRIAFVFLWTAVILCLAVYKCVEGPGMSVISDLFPKTQPVHHDFAPWTSVQTFSELWFHDKCLSQFSKSNMSLAMLPEILQAINKSQDYICRGWLEKFYSIYSVTQEIANIAIPKDLQIKMAGWLGGGFSLEEMNNQEIVIINNEVVGESTLFNVLRSKRPQPKPENPQDEYIEQKYLSSKASCDFCNYTRNTAVDPFGRLEGTYAYTASNAFQLDKLHAMSVFRTHHPTKWTQEAFMEVFQLAGQWFNKAYAVHPGYPYPVIYWDLLPRAGGSQIHPHIHMLLSRKRSPGYLEVWKQAALRYTKLTGQNYFANVVDIHRALGLSVQYRNISALVTLNAKRDYELLLLGDSYGEDFMKLLYLCMQVYFGDFERYAVSLAISLPPMNADKDAQVVPLFARMVTRGVASAVHTDVTSMELFSISSASVEPFGFANTLKQSIEKKLQE